MKATQKPLLIDLKQKSAGYKFGWYLWQYLVITPLGHFTTALYYPILASIIFRAANAAKLPLPINFGQLVGLLIVINLIVYPTSNGLSDHITRLAAQKDLERGFGLVQDKSNKLCMLLAFKSCHYIALGILWLLIPSLVKFAVWAGTALS